MSPIVAPTILTTCHTSPDFDCLGAMLAVKKLFPEAAMLLPPFTSKHSDHVFLASMHTHFGFLSPQDCDLSQVTKLIVVDTRNPKRLEHVQKILYTPTVEIILYDHHPSQEGDLVGNLSHIEKVGACTTILIKEIQKKGIRLTPSEATMLALGIYADTGSFKHGSTTQDDFEAAAFLCRFLPDFSIIKNLTSDITGDQVHLLDLLLRSARTHNIQGNIITIAEVNLTEFHDDFSSIVDKAMSLENYKVFITLAVMHDRVHMIARSSSSVINVGKICSAFNGGGHAEAASAVIKGAPLAEIKSQLIAMLISMTGPESTVGARMTSPAKTISTTTTLSEAEAIMSRFGLKAVPVIDKKTDACVGILDFQTASRAVSHGLGRLVATEYTQDTFQTLPRNADLMQAVTIILRQQQRLVPIVDQHRVVGVLTRTDVMKLLIDEPFHLPEVSPYAIDHIERDITKLLETQLSAEHLELLKKVGKEADSFGVQAFVVGGFVRDLLLKRKNVDFDLSVEGNAIIFANHLAQTLHGRVRAHEKFQTAIVFYKDGYGNEQHLDIATARLEFYERPGALPQVELSSIKMDLYRRDFTINALAIQINESRFGLLIDPFGAQRDIKDKVISVLHSLSFVEDPTRILRAVRFEQRFGFHISAHTERLIKSALQHDMIQHLSGARVFNELRLVFEEKNAPSCIRRFNQWKLLGQLHQGLRLTPAKDIMLSSIKEVLSWYQVQQSTGPIEPWRIYLNALCGTAKYQETSSILERLGFVSTMRKSFMKDRTQTLGQADKILLLSETPGATLSAWYRLLTPLKTESLLFLMAKYDQEQPVKQNISYFITHLQHITLKISGEDLVALGEKPGPLFKETLDTVMLAVIDGKISSKKEQLEFASEYMIGQCKHKALEAGIQQILRGRT